MIQTGEKNSMFKTLTELKKAYELPVLPLFLQFPYNPGLHPGLFLYKANHEIARLELCYHQYIPEFNKVEPEGEKVPLRRKITVSRSFCTSY